MSRPRYVAILYGVTIFLSSFLLFLIQPVFAKLILPWFGGSAAMWTTCLVFYQVALLGGYAYAYAVVRKLSPRWQAMLHLALLAAALAALPVIPGDSWKPAGGADPTWRILGLLVVVLGLPYFMLSTTGPLLQAWYAREWTGSQPYRLFALSNAGALIALAAYPVLIEPRVATHAQDLAWGFGFAGFAVLCALTAWLTLSSGGRDEITSRSVVTTGPTLSQRGMWIALSCAGSMLLLATTNQLTQNVAAVPFLWIVPLAVYLITFILCFESSRWYNRGLFLRLLAVALGGLGYAIYDIQFSDTILVAIPIFTLGLFVGCMFCNGELSYLAPPAEYLTTFYLMIALGGALGAVLVGLVAPLVFSGIYELPLALLVVAALALRLNWDGGWSQRLLWGVATAAMLVVVGAQVRAYHFNTVVVTRNFYGALRVIESGNARALYHGTVKHGSQFLTGSLRASPTTYYGPPSGIGLALLYCCDRPKRVGVVGLGAGTIGAYGLPSDEFEFYEINPEVATIAKTQFSFLKESTAKIQIAIGDARLTLENEPARAFDVLAIDAFSGDAIPVHLLTKEVFALYLHHLKPSGILAVHVSNQFLDLAPVVEQLARFYGYPVIRIQSPKDEDRGLSSATWVLMTRNRDFLSRGEIANVAQPIPPRALRLWTDDYNNLLQVIR
jgi:hypothetical protein